MNLLQQIAYQYGSILHAFQQGEEGNDPLARPKVYKPYTQAMGRSARYQAEYSLAGQEQSQKRALQNSWAYTAITMKAKELSGSVELKIMDWSREDADPIQIKKHDFTKMLRKPNPHMGTSFLWQVTSMWLDLSGNAYWFMVYEEDSNNIQEIWPIPSHQIDPVPGEGDKLIDYYKYVVNGREFHIDPDYICHFKLPNPFDIFRGMPPLIAAMMAIDMDLAMSMWNSRLFTRDNVMPSAIINIKPPDPAQPIDEADIDQLKEDLRDEYSAWQRKTAIVTAGEIQVEKLEWSPMEIDFKGGRDLSKQEIFQIYGIPPGMMDSGATLGNVRLADQIFKEKTLWPLMVLLAEQMTAQIIIPNYHPDYTAEFKDIRPVNRQLELQEYSSASSIMTIDELRKTYFALDPLPDGKGGRLISDGKAAPPPAVVDKGAGKNPLVGQMEGQPSLAEQGIPPAKVPAPGKSNGRA